MKMTNKQFWHILPWLGIVLLVAANLSGIFSQDGIGLFELLLGLLGLVFFLTILARGGRRPNTRGYAMTTMYIAFVLASGIMMYMLALQNDRTYDLTSTRVHSLSALTVKVLHGLDANVKLVAFTELPRETEKWFKKFKSESPRISYEIYSAVRDVVEARRFDSNVLPEDVFIICEKADGSRRQKKISAIEKMDEGEILNAIIEVTRDTSNKIYFLTGDGERALEPPQTREANQLDGSLGEIIRLLRERAFDVVEWSLAEKGYIPSDCTILAIAGPLSDPLGPHLDLIKGYLDEGGKLLLLFDPPKTRRAKFDGLINLLKGYGIYAPDSFVLDENVLTAQGANRFFAPLVTMKGRHPIVQSLPTGQVLSLPFARPILLLEDVPDHTTVEELLFTSPKSWLVDADYVYTQGKVPVPDEEARKIYSIAVLAQKDEQAMRGANSRIFVMGDSDVFTNDVINDMGAVLMINVVNWLAESEDLIAVPPKTLPETPLSLTARQGRVLFSMLAVTLPCLILFGGLGLTLYRRRTR